MKFPKLKNALLCRVLVYVVVLGGFIAPIIIVTNLNFVPETVKVIAVFAFSIGLLIYIVKNFALLMGMDIELTALHCNNTARKRFALPKRFSVKKAERKISKFGKSYPPIAISPRPHALQYKSNASLTIYSSGIEKVLAVYHIDLLDKSLYHTIINSANANSNALKGKKKHLRLDKEQKKSPINRVTVTFIFATRVDPDFRDDMYKSVCQNGGNGYDTANIPCIVDLETDFATFDSTRIPYIGFIYPAKNRGIRLIRKLLFNGKLTFSSSPDKLDPINGMDTEQSLWSYWRASRKEVILDEKETRKRYENMEHKELIFEDGYVYVKWEDKGVWTSAELDEETKIAEIDAICSWDYPKSNMIAKATAKEIEKIISTYFAELGYTASFISLD